MCDPPGEITEILDVDEPDPENQFTPMLDDVTAALERGIKAGHTNALIITLGDDGSFGFDITDDTSLIQVLGVLDIVKADLADDYRSSAAFQTEAEDGPPSA